MNEYQETYEKEISLIELMFYCLKKWRWIVAAMLVMAVLAGGYKYRATVKDNAAKREAELNSDIKGENQKKEVVTNPNIEYYELAIDNTQQNLDTMKDYIDNSVIMNLDAYHLNTGILSFYINADNANDAMLGNLMAAYKTFATDGRLAEALQAAGSKMETSEVQYLIKFDTEELSATEQNANGDATSTVLIAGSQKKPTVFQVQITAENEKKCKTYIEAAEKAFNEYSQELQGKISAHELELLSTAQTERIDRDIESYQTNVLYNYNNQFSSLKTMQSDLKTLKEQEGETIVIGNEVAYASPATAAVKYAIVGLVLGAFLAAFVLVAIFLMSGRLESTDGFREEYGMPLLGQVTKQDGKKRIFGFIDKWLVRLQEGAYADITYEEQVKIAAANLKAAAKEGDLKKIMLAGTIAKEEAEAFRAEFAKELDGITLSGYERIVFQASALEELDSYDGVLFLEKQGTSYSKMIKKERALAVNRDVKVLGAVVL